MTDKKKMVADFSEFTMPIIRSGFPSMPLNMVFAKKPIKPKIPWVWGDERVEKEKEISRSEPESDDFVLTGAL
jgi:hypothetical protein